MKKNRFDEHYFNVIYKSWLIVPIALVLHNKNNK